MGNGNKKNKPHEFVEGKFGEIKSAIEAVNVQVASLEEGLKSIQDDITKMKELMNNNNNSFNAEKIDETPSVEFDEKSDATNNALVIANDRIAEPGKTNREITEKLNNFLNSINSTLGKQEENPTEETVINNIRSVMEYKDEQINEGDAELGKFIDLISKIFGIDNVCSSKEERKKRAEEIIRKKNIEINSLKQTVATKTTELDKLTAENNTKSNEINSLNDTVKENEGKIAKLNSMVTEKEEQISKLTAENNTKSNEINSLNDTVKENEGKIAKLNSMVTEKEEQISKLTAENNTKSNEINSLNDTVKENEGKIVKLNSTITEKEEMISKLNAESNAKSNEINSLNDTVKGKSEEINSLNDTVEGKNSEINRLTNEVDRANATINEYTYATKDFLHIFSLVQACPSLKELIENEFDLPMEGMLSIQQQIQFVNCFSDKVYFAECIYKSFEKYQRGNGSQLTENELALIAAINDYYKSVFHMDWDILDCLNISEGAEFSTETMKNAKDPSNTYLSEVDYLCVPSLRNLESKIVEKAYIVGR